MITGPVRGHVFEAGDLGPEDRPQRRRRRSARGSGRARDQKPTRSTSHDPRVRHAAQEIRHTGVVKIRAGQVTSPVGRPEAGSPDRTRDAVARLVLEGPADRGRAGRAARAVRGRDPPSPRCPGRRRAARRGRAPPAALSRGRGARPAPTRSPTPAGRPSRTPTTTWPRPRCATCARPAASRPSSPSPSTAPPTLAELLEPTSGRRRLRRASQAGALAQALTASGYAASHRAGRRAGVQICQHHCPVAHVAAEFPQLCEAETRAFERVLGTTSNDWPPSPTATGSARPTFPIHPSRTYRAVPERSTVHDHSTPERVLTQDEQIDALAVTTSAGPTPTSPARAPSAA